MSAVSLLGITAAVVTFFVQPIQVFYVLTYRHSRAALSRVSALSVAVLHISALMWVMYGWDNLIVRVSSSIDLLCGIIVGVVLLSKGVSSLKVWVPFYCLVGVLAVVLWFLPAVFVGVAASVFALGVFIPQMLKIATMLRNNDVDLVDGYSTWGAIVAFIGSLLWVEYSILIGNYFLIFSGATHLVTMGIILGIKFVKYIRFTRSLGNSARDGSTEGDYSVANINRDIL